MRSLFVLFAAAALSVAMAAETATCGWEGTETVLGVYGDVIATIATDPVHGGAQSLQLEDDQASGTPQAFVGWVTGLADGDEVTATVWRYDMTPGSAPSCRLWAHWNDDPGDINGYNGSASGQSEYGPGTGWDMAEYTWTVVEGHTGLVIEVRTYSEPGDIVWVDDLTVTSPDGTTITVPADAQSLQGGTWAAIKASF